MRGGEVFFNNNDALLVKAGGNKNIGKAICHAFAEAMTYFICYMFTLTSQRLWYFDRKRAIIIICVTGAGAIAPYSFAKKMK